MLVVTRKKDEKLIIGNEIEIQVLRIEIDEVKKSRQVSEITETEYFQELRKKAKELRLK